MTTTHWPVLEQAHDALRVAVRGTTDWTKPSPCSQWNAAQVLQHAAGDQLAFAAFLTGGPGPSYDPFAPSGELDASPETIADQAMKLSAGAWANVAADAEEVPVPVPPNKMSATLGVGACALDAAVHAWDIALASGKPSPLAPELARELLPVAQRVVEPLRAYGAYASALTPQPGDDDVTVLLRYLGRRPDWTA